MHFTLTLSHVVFLILAGLFGGAVDSIAGGGGLITVPALLIVGMPPVMMLGTNRLQGAFGELVATIRYWPYVIKSIRHRWWGIFFAALGSVLGTLILLSIHPEHLQVIIPFLMFAVLIYAIFSPKPTKALRQRMPIMPFFILAGLVIGGYNGFFGPGTGSFYVAASMYFLGRSVKDSAMLAKPLNCAGNIAAVIWLGCLGQINYLAAVIMIIGVSVGVYLGTHFVIHKESTWIRRIFILVVAIMTITVFIKTFA